ncbi:uncharacterized protein LOC142322784 [Lycorma delicatula]|uniref:uncharacterized protein LOC142322784 n=1 Tax=Lycorma delicatula TaxID=130591 RepID=UPI003F5138E5
MSDGNRKDFIHQLNNRLIATNLETKSVGDLTVGKPYEILWLRKIATCYGKSIVCRLRDGEEEPAFNVYLPRRFADTLNDDEFDTMELDHLKKNTAASKKSKLVSLNPFLHQNGIVRVGAHLNFSNLSLNAKHPVILSPHRHLTRLIILHEHLRLSDGGLQLIHSLLRQKYWIVNSKIIIRSVIDKCLTCFRFRTEPHSQLLEQPQKERVTISRPLQSTGVDYAGPILIRHGGDVLDLLILRLLKLTLHCLYVSARRQYSLNL